MTLHYQSHFPYIRASVASDNFIKIEPQASVFISQERHKNERRQVNEKSCEF